MGRRVCMAQYGAPLHAQQKARPFWSVMLWELSRVVIEEGYLKGKKFE